MPETHQDPSNEAAGQDSGRDQSGAPQALSDSGLMTLLKLGTKAYSERDYKAAVDFLERAIDKDPTQWKALVCLGLSYFHLQEYSKAQSAFATIVTSCPEEDIVVRAVQAMDKVNAAIGAGGATDRIPGPERTHEETGMHLGLNHREQEGNYDPQATGAFQKKDLPQAEREKLIKWGTNCYLDNKYEKAVEYLEAGLSGEDENWNARLTLGMSYYKLGQYNIAEIVINAIIAQCNDQKMLLRAKQAMDNIKAETQVDEKASQAFEEALAAKAAQKAEAKAEAEAERKKHKLFIPKIQPDARSQARSNDGKRRSHPATIPLLVLIFIGLAYYAALQSLPSIYKSSLMTDTAARTAKGVASLGLLDSIAPKELEIPGPNATKISARYYEKPGAERLVILHPATFDDLEMRKSLAESLLNSGVSVVVYDPRGIGGSSGALSWEGAVDDGLFVYDYMHSKYHFKGNTDIISYGCSIGAATAAGAAQMRPHLAVIIENPFVSIPHLMRVKNPTLQVFPDNLCPEPFCQYYQGDAGLPPALIVSTRDPIVPTAETQLFIGKVAGQKETVELSSPPTAPHWDPILKFVHK